MTVAKQTEQIAQRPLVEEVTAALAEMTWLKPSDGAAKALALKYATQIDAAAKLTGPELTKALYLGPHLLNALRALGGTPAERKGLEDGGNVKGSLGRLRAEAGRAA